MKKQSRMGDGTQSTKSSLWRKLRRQWQLQLFALIGMAFLLIFRYIPLAGIVIAFKNYSINAGVSSIFTSDWNHFAYFKEFFNYYKSDEVIWNTVILSVLKLLFTFPAPIILAILLSEMRNMPFRRIVQTVSYLPNFISWILVYTIANAFLNADHGAVQNVLLRLGWISKPISFMTAPGMFRPMAAFWAVWKNTGWWAIIFLAAIMGIDQGLYDAAMIDGAGRFQRIWHITLPGIRSAITTVLILSLGGLFGGGMGGSNFDQAWIFGNQMNNATSEIVQTYAFRMGLIQGRFAFATAVDLLQSIFAIIMILVSNFAVKKATGEGLF